MTASTPSPSVSDDATVVELTPSYRIPLVLIAIALPGVWLQPWLGGLVGLFGLFLLVQTLTLRLRFTDTALDIYRGERLIRRFPYQDWEVWEIFWSPVPVLFYFREVNSIHFLPILFSPKQLADCLTRYCPDSATSL